jgi:hypothetical protein
MYIDIHIDSDPRCTLTWPVVLRGFGLGSDPPMADSQDRLGQGCIYNEADLET